jgi:transcription-repair coupling factor
MQQTKIACTDKAAVQTISIFQTPLSKESGAVLWCLENNQQIKIYSDLLNTWQKYFSKNKKQIFTWPDNEEISLELLIKLQNNKNIIILTSFNNLEQNIPAWEYLNKNKITLKINQDYSLIQLAKDLVALGFEQEPAIYQNNQFNIHGNVIDIYQQDKIYRINFELNNIEYISQDNKEIPEINIYSNKNIHKQSFINSLPINCLLIYENHQAEYFADLKSNSLIFDSLSKSDFEFVSESISPLQKNKKNIFENKQDYNIFWFSKNKTLANKILKKYKLKANIIDYSQSLKWPDMFVSDQDKILVINDTLFFLEEKLAKQSKQQREFLPDFKVGDVVVHRDHGIAHLDKITTMTVDDIKREYMVLAYADNDTLFVPLELADKIEKYVGPQNPKIQRLSIGNTWPQTLKKIKDHTLQLANELLHIEATRKLHQTPVLKKQDLNKQVAGDFPYQVTPSQEAAIQDVMTDLQSDSPADRLICGDVGFGKTEVALRAAAHAVANGYQVAILCPTTILAQQHYDNFINRLEKYGVNIALLTRWQDKSKITQNIAKIKNNQIDIIIGTHRLLSRDIIIPKLQLLIIDEEQNFGVEAKEKLKKHKANINLLTLTATPIPRTLNLALSAIKDISLITHPISDRKSIKTEVHKTSDEIISHAIQQELDRQGQVYFLHNRVETISLAHKKIKKLFPKARIAIAHGQLEDKELAAVMHDFDNNKIDILICSTIIANGLDIPNANTLIITEADRFGLAQLHQLRGRIGRADKQAYAYFLYSVSKLKKNASLRLSHLKLASDLGAGFKIAHRDLELRGVGNILGKAQSGKVKSIGLGFYQQLIAETIADLKGQVYQTWRDIEIKLKLDTTVPNKMFNNIAEKLSWYQKISRIRNIEDIKKLYKKHKDPNIHNILWLQEIRILSQATDIYNISTYKTKDKEFVAFDLIQDLDNNKLLNILKINNNYNYNNNRLKINTNFLKDIKEIKKAVISI